MMRLCVLALLMLVASVVARAASSDVDALLPLLDRWSAEKNPEVRDQLALELEVMVTFGNATSICQRLRPGRPNTPVALRAVELWSAKEPAKAFRWLSELPDATDSELAAVVRAWMVEDPAALRHCIDRLDASPRRRQLVSVAASSARLQNLLEEATYWLPQMEPGERTMETMEWVAMEMGKRDVARAAHWVSRHSNAEAQDRLLGRAAMGMATRDPAAALEFVDEVLAPGYAADQVNVEIVTAWADRHRRDALAWAARLPEGSRHEQALEAVLSRWAEHAAPAAAMWAAGLPRGPKRVRSLHIVATHADGAMLGNLMELIVERITDAEAQNETVAVIARQWRERDPASSFAWFQALSPHAFSVPIRHLLKDMLGSNPSAATSP